jgi:hypothetical protein
MKRSLVLALTFQLGLAGPALAQTLGQGGGVEVSLWRVLLSLFFCVGLGAAAVYLLRKQMMQGRLELPWKRLGFAQPEVQRRIRVADQQFLGPQRSIYLIEIDGEPYAALFAPQAATLIPLAKTAEPAAEPPE